MHDVLQLNLSVLCLLANDVYDPDCISDCCRIKIAFTVLIIYTFRRCILHLPLCKVHRTITV